MRGRGEQKVKGLVKQDTKPALPETLYVLRLLEYLKDSKIYNFENWIYRLSNYLVNNTNCVADSLLSDREILFYMLGSTLILEKGHIQ